MIKKVRMFLDSTIQSDIKIQEVIGQWVRAYQDSYVILLCLLNNVAFHFTDRLRVPVSSGIAVFKIH